MNSGIYTITNLVNGKMYIGFARNLNERKDHHFTELRKNIHANDYMQKAFNKYGEKNFIFEKLVECPIDLLASEEHYWATLLNVHDQNYGYNIKPTHPYGKCSHAEITKYKISNSNKGRIAGFLNKKHSKESKSKIGEGNKNKIRSEECKQNLREKKIGSKSSQETKNKISKNSAFSKPVIQYTLNDEFVKEHESGYAACRSLGKQYLRIRDACLGTNGVKQTGGFKWKYKK